MIFTNNKKMKNLLAVLLVTFSLNGFTQQKPLEWHTEVDQAVNLSIKTGKPLFLFFTGSDWCGWCKRLQKEVFFKSEFTVWALKNVILLELDFNRSFQNKIKKAQTGKATLTKNENSIIEVSQLFQVRGYPTIWFATPQVQEGKVMLGRLGSQGYVAGGPKAWIAGAEKIINSKE